MAIDLTTFWGTWDVVSGNTSATNQYEFWKGMVMSTGQILNNQYEFFQYHNTTRYEWFKNLQGTYPEVYDEYTFYKNTSNSNIYDMRTFYEYGAVYLTGGGTTTTTTTAAPVDADYAAFMAAVVATGGTTNSTISAATLTLFTDLKAAGLYSKLDVLMPMIGGTYGSIVINAKNPTLDLWKWTNFGSSSIFNSSGITTNASGVLKSNWTMGDLVQSTTGSSHFSIYCSSPSSTNNAFNGALNGSNFRFASGFYGNVPYIGQWQNGQGFAGGPAQRKGLWTANKLTYNTLQFYIDDTLEVNTGDGNWAGDVAYTYQLAIGTLYLLGQPNNLYNGDLYTATYATVTIGSGLTSGEMTDLYDIILAFNTALSRN
jgi:hypothetical protein